VAELPTGTVTFLFTDVEGSTRLLQELGDAYAEVLAEHRRALRDAFARHGGIEVDTQGDAFFVAFAKATGALAAATEARQVLEGGPIRVRMGLHTGEPLVTEDGYVGIDVHRAARIAAAGHGGQILVSHTTRQLVQDGGLRDLGEHRLKDLTAPERIYQLGDGDFPPLKSLNQTNLPVQPTPLVGRQEELREITELLRASRLLTLTGAGGSGKTRLALQAAAQVVEEFPDGVWFVSLASVSDARLVEPAIAQVVGAPEDLRQFLHERKMLLLLDNLEQLLPDVAQPIMELDAHVLATSRERLNLSIEQEYPVSTLPLEDAVAVFAQRARQLMPGFEVDEHVMEICRRLDGLPLAVELAAARTKLLTTEQILGRLRRGLEVLAGGTRDMPERQRTLQATIQWSCDLLGNEERRAFARLAVFAGSFDVEAAEDVCGADLETLESLVDKSLLRRTGEGRLFMLETIREFALEQLAATPEAGATRRRHVEHALSRAEQPPYPGIPDWLRHVERDYSELRGALSWLREQHEDVLLLQLASRLGRFWDSRALLQEGRMWLEAAVATAPAGPSSEIVEAFTRLGHIAWRQGDLEAARPALDSAEAGARELGDMKTIGWLHTNRGAICITTGDLVEARSEYEFALAIFREIGATHEAAIATHDLGLIATEERDYRRARRLLEESAGIARSNGFSGAEANALGSLGLVAFEQGDLAEAWEKTVEAIRLNRTENFTNLPSRAIC